MERDIPTLAARLRAEGYTTGLVFDTPMFMTQGNFLDRGFGSIEWIRGQGGEPWISDGFADIQLPAAEHKVKEGLKRYLMNQTRRQFESDYLGPRVITEAVHWLEKNYKQDQFFLWIDSWDPHEPWDPPQYYVDLYDPGYEGDEVMYPCYGFAKDIMSERELEHVKALYAGEVTMVDRWLGQLFELIELTGLKENTLVLLMSDHGHYFGDHGLQGKPWGDLGQLYEPMTRLVMMVQHPQATPGRVSGLVQPVDFFPTVCELAGVEAPNGLQGHSFAEQLRGTGSGSRQYAITGRNLNDSWGTVPATITDGEWSLVYWPNKDLKYKNPPVRQETYANIGMPERRVEELFYLPNDPGQEKNVLASHPDEAKRLHAALLDLIAEADVEPEMAATYQRSPGENYHLE
jgi:arylsulfatase A-like enzyme